MFGLISQAESVGLPSPSAEEEMRKSQLIQTVKDNPEQLTRLMQKLPESYPQMSRGPPPPLHLQVNNL